MNAQRNDHRDDMSAPHDAVANLVRATSEAMEAFMKTDWTKEKDESGVALNPLMANPAVMMAAATAYGIRMTGQWASMFLNVLQEQAERVQEAAAAEPDETVAAEAPKAEPGVAESVEAAVAETVVAEAAKGRADAASEASGTVAPVADAVVEKRARKAARTAKVRKAAEKEVVSAAQSPAGDDLKRISGIGPKLSNVLTGHGVVTFAQLAQMDEAALASLDAELGLEGRILRDDWAGQARAILAAGN
jgi:NADH-quinone oxidoreductase subunit E